MWDFQGSWFLALEVSRDLTQFCGISRGGALLCLEFLNLLENYLTNRHQRVLLNGQNSSWTPVLAGVPQGSILDPLLFLIYINDLPNGLKANAKLFADDTSLFAIVKTNKKVQIY